MKPVIDALEALKNTMLAQQYTTERSRNVEAIDEILRLVWDHLASEAGL